MDPVTIAAAVIAGIAARSGEHLATGAMDAGKALVEWVRGKLSDSTDLESVMKRPHRTQAVDDLDNQIQAEIIDDSDVQHLARLIEAVRQTDPKIDRTIAGNFGTAITTGDHSPIDQADYTGAKAESGGQVGPRHGDTHHHHYTPGSPGPTQPGQHN